ncbi:MAG TPA: GNAT family N-acetyltransferase [Alphaproteobacteria bacterium]|nr:GNAT family N-acetyltransferase [Alphaproteobacteria bacterium]
MPATQPQAEGSSAPTYRVATKSDVATILKFICGLAEYEKLAHEVVATEEILTRTLFGPKSYAECLLAEVDGVPAGFALFFHTFSTFLGKPGIYLEDLFVPPEHRGSGIGKGFFRELARIAVERDCGRLEWAVLDWNEPAIEFYKTLGAQSMDGWTTNRLTRPEIEKLVKG